MIGSFWNKCRRWVPTAYKQSYNSYKQGKITPVTHGIFLPFITGPHCTQFLTCSARGFRPPPCGWIPGRGLTVVFCIGEQLSERTSPPLPSLVGGEFWVLCAFFWVQKNHGTLKTLQWMCAFSGERICLPQTTQMSNEKLNPGRFRLFFRGWKT